jgi:hypothetical protein
MKPRPLPLFWSQVAYAVVVTVLWYPLSLANPIAGAYFAGLAISGLVIVSLLRPRRPFRDDGYGGGGGGGGWEPSTPVDPDPDGIPQPITRPVVSDLTADALIAQWATTPAAKPESPEPIRGES